MPDPFVNMIKPVGSQCNLTCFYCYYLGTDKSLEQEPTGRMPDDLLEKAIVQTIKASPGPVVSFVWHGGEPTLAGLDFYRMAVSIQKANLPSGWSCWNSLQTNGVLLDDAWCDFLAESGFSVGISLDGSAEIHDAVRRDRVGKGTYQRVVAAVRRLQERGIQPDLLCTVTRTIAEQPVEVYRALRDLETGWMQFIPIIRQDREGRLTADSVSGEAYGRFLCSIFDTWLAQDIGRQEVQIFAEMLLISSGRSATVCQMSPTCGRAIVVEKDGRVFSCDHFVTPEHCLGSLHHAELQDLLESERQRIFGRNKKDLLPGRCRSCSWLRFCHGGCPKDRLAGVAGGEEGLNVLCAGYQQFFQHAEKPVARMAQLLNQGFSIEAVRSDLRGYGRKTLIGVGRNDPCPCGSGRKAKNCCLR
jgi:uncharacterized protein